MQVPPLFQADTVLFLANKEKFKGTHFIIFFISIISPGAVVAEGGRVTIDRSKLDASNLLGNLPESNRKDHHIMYRVISLPRHGALTIQGHNLTR